MANIKPTKLQMFNGLRRRPHYEEISQEINPDKTQIIYPNRDATRLRNDPRMTQMDGLGMFESLMEQQEATTREQRKETIIQEIAKDEGIGIKEAKSKPPPAPPPSGPSGSGANPRMPYAPPPSGPSGSGANPRMFPPRMPYAFEFGAGDPQTDHEAAIAEARNMSKQQRMTKQERNDANMARHLAQQQDKMADLIKKQRQTDLDNRRTMPDENLSAADESFHEAEATKSESDKPIPKRKGRPTKKDAETKKPAVKKEEPAEVKEIKKEEEIKKELKEEFKKQKEERSKSVPDKAMRERSKSRDAKSDPEPTPPRQKRRSKLERSRSRDAPPLPTPKAKAKGRPKKEFVEDVKEEVAKIEKRQESSDPESKHESKGSRGRPRSTSRPPQGASSSSSGNKPPIDSNSGLADIGRLTKSDLLKAIIDHGFQGKQLVEIQKKTKSEIVLFIDQLIKDDRWR